MKSHRYSPCKLGTASDYCCL